MELGLYTFGDVGTDPVTGRHTGPEERLRQLVDEIALADEVGLDFSVSANTIAPTTPSRPRPLRWPLPPSSRNASSCQAR